MSNTFSTFVIEALVDVITGGAGNSSNEPIGRYRTGPEIEKFFMGCGIDMRIGGASRLSATLDALRDVQNRIDGNAVLERILTNIADPRHYISNPAKGTAVIEHLNTVLEADGYSVSVLSGKATLGSSNARNAAVAAIIGKSEVLNFDTVQRDVARAMQSAKSDPEDAVTAACSLIESVCRSILIELSLPLPKAKDIDGLMKAVQEPLGLSPGRMDLPSEIENDVRQVLGGLTTVSKGVGALRTHAGDAHGRERGVRRIDARIAHLAINAASTIALFLIETWERKAQRALPFRAEERHG